MKKILFVFVVLALIMSACTPPVVATPTPEVIVQTETEVITNTVEIPVEVLVSNTVDFAKFQNGSPFRWAHDNQQHPVARMMAAGFLSACDDFGLACENMATATVDTPAVLAMMEQSIALGSSGQIFPIYLPEHYAQAQSMIDAGIPVVGTHFPVDPANVPGLLAWVAPDNVGYALETAEAMAEKTACGSPIAITQSSLNDGENAVAENFRNRYLEVCPDAEVLPVEIEGFDIPQAILIASAIIQAHPDLVGAFSTTGNGPSTWAGAAKDTGKAPGEITIISMDYTSANLALVESGEVYMLVGQPLYEEFYYATVLLLLHDMGFPVPYENYLPAPLITIENYAQYQALNAKVEAVEFK